MVVVAVHPCEILLLAVVVGGGGGGGVSCCCCWVAVVATMMAVNVETVVGQSASCRRRVRTAVEESHDKSYLDFTGYSA